MEQIMPQLEKAVDKLMEGMSKYGPDAVNLTLEVGRVAAVKDALQAIGGLLLAYVLYRFTRYCIGRVVYFWTDPEMTRKDMEPASIPFMIGTVLATIGAAVSLTGSMGTLTNAFVWVGLFRPEIYLAAKLLNL